MAINGVRINDKWGQSKIKLKPNTGFGINGVRVKLNKRPIQVL